MTHLKSSLLAALLGATSVGLAAPAMAADLRIALQSDADVLDPDQSRTFVGRIVYTALCDKLVDITPDLEIIPQLATGWSWSDDGTALTMTLREGVVFHDGTPFDAQAVADNITRSQTMEASRRKSELKSIASTEVLGSHEIKLNLTAPDATLLAQLADRAGMMVSPTAATAAGADFGLNPVCSGPFAFGERVAQDRIVLNKFADYWNADQIHFDSVTYLPIPDTTVRLANLQSGDIDMLERLAATDLAQAKSDDGIQVESAISLGYQGITFNINNGEKGDNPWGNDKRLRQALSYAIDREAINQVVFDGAFAAGNQPVPPNSPWYNSNHPVPARDLDKARALLAEAGYPDGIDLEVQVPNTTVPLQLMQVVQAMAAEAGINITITSKEFATLLADQSAGDYQASQIGWSGRVDPDGNNHQFVTTNGGINDSEYSNADVDRLMNAARASNDIAERKASYDAARDILNEDLPRMMIYHQTWIWALDDSIKGFVPYPDGMIRLEGMMKDE
ncbi:ABC transporter substrate-binding protein [Sedimentitalea nanhaiensis]|uniref:Peptide/nickel transport system substrate-binding protein n=1 Tax=Sedimentitalea nanhaiensis TaxID=999627 RepID=A0A1I7BHA6_9RHOB|nr:ABC transporter substrate-binding protein [Sedimentitalea nanhaiensis]SFT86527.1 peptide/nickel transport system substrate-binding protein [Sedimentitalea nanhaiensis]